MPILQGIWTWKNGLGYISLWTHWKGIESDPDFHWDFKHSEAVDLAVDWEKVKRDSREGREGYLQYHYLVQTQILSVEKTPREDKANMPAKLNSIEGRIDEGEGSFEAGTDLQAHDGGYHESSEGSIGTKLSKR